MVEQIDIVMAGGGSSSEDGGGRRYSAFLHTLSDRSRNVVKK